MRGGLGMRIDISLPPTRGAGAAVAGSQFTSHSFALPYETGSVDGYWVGGTRYATIGAVPGYTNTRSGQVSMQNASAAIETFAANAPAIPTGIGYYSRNAATNLLLNAGSSGILATQSVTLPASAHTLSFIGTGTVTLSGASTAGPLVGTGATNRVVLTFTPTAGSVTFTVTGSVTYSGLIAGTISDGGPIIATTGVTASSGEDIQNVTASAPINEDMVIWARVKVFVMGTNRYALQLNDGTTNNRIALTLNASNFIVADIRSGAVGIYAEAVATSAVVAGQETTLVLRRLSGAWQIGKYAAGTLTWGVSTAAAVPAGINQASLGNHVTGTVALDGSLEMAARRVGTYATDAAVIALITV